MENNLVEDDLSEILQRLSPVDIRWREIGVQLGLRQDVLDRIAHENHDLMICLSKMVSEWLLKRNYNIEKFGEPSWRKLAEAVGNAAGGRNPELARQIKQEHCDHIAIVKEKSQKNTLKDNPSESHSTFSWCCCSSNTNKQSRRPATATYSKLLENDISASKKDLTKSFDKSVNTIQAIPTWKLKDVKNQPSYHGAMTEKVAEFILEQQTGESCYLMRYSEQRKVFVISVLTRNRAEKGSDFHASFTLNITKGEDGNIYEIEGTEETFGNISKLLAFYENNPLDAKVKSIGKPCNDEPMLKRYFSMT